MRNLPCVTLPMGHENRKLYILAKSFAFLCWPSIQFLDYRILDTKRTYEWIHPIDLAIWLHRVNRLQWNVHSTQNQKQIYFY